MKNALVLALVSLPLVACGGAMDDGQSVDEQVGVSQSELANPASSVINFDRDPSGNPIPDGTVIDTMYTSAFGVTFTGLKCTPGPGCASGHAFAQNSVLARSMPNVVGMDATTIPIYDSHVGGVRADFATPRRWVSIEVAAVVTAADWVVPPTTRPWFEAYDANGALVGQVYYPFLYGQPGWGTYQTLRIDAGATGISWVRFSSQFSSPGRVYGEFDNLRFNSNYVCVKQFGC